MAFSDEETRIWKWLKASIPTWLHVGAREVEYGLTAMGGVLSDLVYWMADQTYIALSNETFLRKHARNVGTAQRYNETIEALRARLQRPSNVVAGPQLEDEANDILTRNGLPAGALSVAPAMDGAWADQSYAERGYGVSRGEKPTTVIMVLPYGTTTAAAEQVKEMLRKHKASGVGHVVEVRAVP